MADDTELAPLDDDEWRRAADIAFSYARVGHRLAAIAVLRAHLPLIERDAVDQAIAAAASRSRAIAEHRSSR